jgi:type I restriction enzyme S subunit
VKRYAKYKDSGIDWIGKIPKSWNICRLKNLIYSHQAGAWGDEPLDDGNNKICIRVSDFDFDRLIVGSGEYTYVIIRQRK